jgi:O-antigen biosynthesis protein
MGDLFRREAATSPQPFTGERLTSSISGQVSIEHYHRYLFARTFCHGRDVLDVASGEGYGAAQLAHGAQTVIGLEYDADTVRSATRNFRRPNLTYLQGDARAIPLHDHCVDVVVSFETIEHFDRQDVFVSELHRVLRPGGLCILSTPDRDIYSSATTPPNPFHVKELSATEFLHLLGSRFQHTLLLRQRSLSGSALLPDAGSGLPTQTFERRGDTHFEACIGLPRAPYVVAIASDQALPPVAASLYIDRSDLDTDPLALRECSAALRQAEEHLALAFQRQEEAERRLSALAADLHDARTELAASNTVRMEAEAAHRAAGDRADATARDLDLIRGSARTFLRFYLPRLRRHLLRGGLGRR